MKTQYRRVWLAQLVAAGLLWGTMTPVRAGEEAAVRRFALLAGANYGGLDRVRLRFAETDAVALSGVMGELGGVLPADMTLLLDPRPRHLRAVFPRIKQALAQARPGARRLEFVFYYSGHSDETGLLLHGEKLSYPEIRAMIRSLGADVSVAILDSCASGAFTRTKGGVRGRPFLFDDANKVRGYAVLTSSSATESAQESDRIGGSFFTHYLVSGLRGAADLSHDGTVTLNEAYQYAFAETLARTEATQQGAQHANYDFQLAGSGDLVLTDLRQSSARLELAPELVGRLFIRNQQGQLVAEVNKQANNQAMSLGLAPGVYRLTLDTGTGILRGEVEVRAEAPSRLSIADLQVIEPEQVTARGGPPIAQADQDRLALNLIDWEDRALAGLELSLVGTVRSGAVRGAQVAVAYNVAHNLTGLQLSAGANLTTGESRGLLLAAFGNAATESFTGVQGSAFLNVARSFRGLQVSTANVTWDDIRGVQLSVANYTHDLTGAQAGVVNVAAGEVRGAQIGVVNYGTRVKGLMLGLVNVAAEVDDDTLPIGLINLFGNGLHELEFFTSDTSLFNLGLKLGSRRFYTLLGAGIHPEKDNERWSVYTGLGMRIELDSLWLDIDLLAHAMEEDYQTSNDDFTFLTQIRALVGWQLADQLAVFGGLSLNLLLSDVRPSIAPPGWSFWETTTDEGTYLQLAPGFVLGLQI